MRPVGHRPIPSGLLQTSAIALIGALTWLFGLWLGPWLVPGPQVPERVAVDHDTEIDAFRNVLALSVPDGMTETRGRTLSRTAAVRRGDTLMEVLTRSGVDRFEAHRAITALRDVFDPRDLRPDTELTLNYRALTEGTKPPLSFRGFNFKPSVEETVTVERAWDSSFRALKSKDPLVRSRAAASGIIKSSLYTDALAAEVPVALVVELIRAYSFDVDFQREIHPGDRFEVFYDRLMTPEGDLAKAGEIIHAALTLGGKRLLLYRFRMDDGEFDYFNEKGESVRKALMRTPIDGARLSSRFGRRRHPILGYTRMHKGTDFAAPPGTPIMAAGRGVVVAAGRNGGYGLYVRIRHNATYSTAYAHMRAIAKGIRRGRRVRQGQVIGYVGSTGRSTGPHLHYEVLRNNRQTNPLSLRLPTGKKLRGAELKRFRAAKAEVDAAYAGMADAPPDRAEAETKD